MSRIAIFSDVHANLLALEKIVEDATAQGVNSFACLGDIVGYGPNPGDCITFIQELKCVCVKGNHDEYVVDGFDLSDFNPQAKASLEWTRNNLSDNQKQWLSELPYSRRLGRNTLVHSSLDEPETWDYVRNENDARRVMRLQNTPLCFYGHTHVPVIYKSERGMTIKQEVGNFTQEGGCKYLINTGSVGQPRDGDPRSSYVIFDRIERTVEFRRVEYDLQTVANEILGHGLPDWLADRLIIAS